MSSLPAFKKERGFYENDDERNPLGRGGTGESGGAFCGVGAGLAGVAKVGVEPGCDSGLCRPIDFGFVGAGVVVFFGAGWFELVAGAAFLVGHGPAGFGWFGFGV